MRKDQLYLLTLVGITLTVICINVISVNQLIKYSTEQLLKTQLESSKREAFEISRFIETQLASGVSKEGIVSGLQRSIENTSMETGFICMYNTSGVEIIHPNANRVGVKIDMKNSNVSGIAEDSHENFYNILKNGKPRGGIRDFLEEDRSELIYVHPVRNTDWMVAAHANISGIQERLATMKVNIILVNSLAAIFIILLSFTIVRWLGSQYEKGIELEKEKLVDDLTKLNMEITAYKYKVDLEIPLLEPVTTLDDERPTGEKLKRRVLTYWRDELVSIPVEDIAFCYTQNDLTYVNCLSKKVFNANVSLEELFESLDKAIFFRANRQFVISIRSIDKIYRYGSNQLKIATNPPSPEDVIISKNKAAEFKEWLNS